MFALKCLLLVGVLAVSQAVEFEIVNNLGGPIWVGILGNDGRPPLSNGGFALNQYESRTVSSSDDWAGRFWARTWCDPNTGVCQTGNCGNQIECNGNGGAPPVTLAEITLRGWQGLDFYDISLVDGYNVMASIEPINGDGQGVEGRCRKVGCNNEVNTNCPEDLKVFEWGSGQVIACNSACNKYNTDEYCCRGAWGTPETCNPATWASNSAAHFKGLCPDAYSYAYDDQTSTFTCVANRYKVVFG